MTRFAEGEGWPDLLTMSGLQWLVLDRMSPDMGYPFRDIALDCGAHWIEARGIIRKFHELGMTRYGPLYDEDDGHVCGKGYWLSRLGANLQRQMRAFVGQRYLWAMRAHHSQQGEG